MTLVSFRLAACLLIAVAGCGAPEGRSSGSVAAPDSDTVAPPAVETAEVEAEVFKLVMLGDSLTAGFGLADPDRLVNALEARVGSVRGEPLEIVNAGVSGDTAAGARARFGFSVPDDADGVLIEIGANDMFQQREPRHIAGDIAAIVEEAEARGLWAGVIGVKAPLNAGAYKAEFDRLYPDLALHYCLPLYDFYFTGIVDPETGAAREDLLLPDLLHPNAAGLEVVADNMGPWLKQALNSDEEPC